MLRAAGSLRHGWTPASLLVTTLQSAARRNRLTKTIQEYGRIIKTLSLLRYLHDDNHRRRIHGQLNKGETLHALRREIFYANRGEIRRRRDHDQDVQTHRLNLLTNAVISWNTVYISAIRDHLVAAGQVVPDTTLARVSPAVRNHINVYGRYDLHAITAPQPGHLRPLRNP